MRSSSVAEDDLNYQIKTTRKVTGWLIEDLLMESLGKVRSTDDEQWLEIIDDLEEADGGIIRLVSGLSDSRANIDNKYVEYRIKQIEFLVELLNEFAKKEKLKLKPGK